MLTYWLFPLPYQDVLTGARFPALKPWHMNECSGVEILTLRGICRRCVISPEAHAVFSLQQIKSPANEGLLTSAIPPDTYRARSASSETGP